jgi:mannose-6-phosphate isomerase-like protein (cupin superfamily)
VPVKNPPPDAIAPDGSEIRFLVTDAQRASLVHVTLPAGIASRPVRHRTVEEIWYLTSEGEVWRCPPGADPAEQPAERVGPGVVVVIPTGWAFQFRAGERPLTFLCYTSPPWPGDEEAMPVAKGAWPATV